MLIKVIKVVPSRTLYNKTHTLKRNPVVCGAASWGMKLNKDRVDSVLYTYFN